MIINLRDFYPHLQNDCLEDIPEEIVALLERNKLNDESHARKVRYQKPLSLDFDDGDKKQLLIIFDISPEAVYEQKLTTQQLYNALSKITPTQQRRIFAHFILGLTETEIARREGKAQQTISESIHMGLIRLRGLLNKCKS